MRAMNAWLETASGDKVPIIGNCSIGRDAGNVLVVPDNQVSRRHAMIHGQAGEHWIVDLGSSNGVLLNGRRVRAPMALKDQDKLDVGSYSFVFRQSAPEPGTPERAAETTSYMTIKSSRTADLWLLIADIEKFTPLSQSMPGDQLAKMVGKWIAGCKDAIEKTGGEINKYLGDGFLAYWPHPDTKPESVAAALASLKQIQKDSSLPFRLVVHYGSITIDNSLSEGEDALIGPQVNFIFRMEKVAGSIHQRCILSGAAADLLKTFAPVAPQGEHTMSGFEGTHLVYSY
jgi:adenylate cyclase